jgi:two-component system LytT family response regulator
LSDVLRLLIADDEPLARALMRRYAQAHRDVVVAGECADGDQLATALATNEQRGTTSETLDVLLLDIVMPGRNVFDVLASFPAAQLPLVIFTTAFDRYAVRAFEVNAVDYLLKPLTAERLGGALARARERRTPAPDLTRLSRDLGTRPDRILVPHRGRLEPVPVADVVWIKAEGDYSRLHTAEGRSYLVTRTLGEMEKRLDPAHFLRIHRSAIVRLDAIRSVKSEGSARLSVVLQDQTRLIVSRARSPQLKRWMI